MNMSFRSPIRIVALVAGLLAAGAALAAGGGSIGGSMPSVEPASPESEAKSAYNSGVRAIRQADGLKADAIKASDAARRAKLEARAREAYATAQRRFSEAIAILPDMHESWNYLGYSARNLGDYTAALSAYDRALALKSDYHEAIEYRGQAYLGLNRVADAKQAYLVLFAANRQLADRLLAAMQSWAATKRAMPDGVDALTLAEFEAWISERATIAAQTAQLTREGTAAGWR